MRVILTFTLPREHEEHRAAIHGLSYHEAICDLRIWLRDQVKYNDLSNEEAEVYERVRQVLTDALADNGVLEDFS